MYELCGYAARRNLNHCTKIQDPVDRKEPSGSDAAY